MCNNIIINDIIINNDNEILMCINVYVCNVCVLLMCICVCNININNVY